jgi:hypothetical protein
MKKRWEKPELTILLKSRAEEAVLVTCKTMNINIQGPNSVNKNCALFFVPCHDEKAS